MPHAHQKKSQVPTNQTPGCPPRLMHMRTKRDTAYPPKDHVTSKINSGCPTRCQLVTKTPRTHQKYHTVPSNIPGGTQNARWPPKERLVAYQDGSWPPQCDMPNKQNAGCTPICQVPTKGNAGWLRRCQVATW